VPDHIDNKPAERKTKAPARAGKSGRMIPPVLRPGNTALVFIQEQFNKIFTPQLNPLYYLGAITFLMFWVLLATGAYLFLFYNMNPVGAYQSVQRLTEDQKYYGGIIRSLHRYASDGIVILITIHMIQVFFSDRFRRYRWVAWVSGAVIIPVLWFEGVSGYVLVWDETAQMIALTFSEVLDALPINAEPAPRNFLTNDSINQLLFFVLNYLHMAIPILLLILAWVHCMRISMPLVNPPRRVTVVILGSMVALSLVKPAVSAPPADLGKLVGEVAIDWFYLPAFPLLHELQISGGTAWILGIIGYGLFLGLPWIIPEPKKPPAEAAKVRQCVVEVDLESCKGCVLCQMACPFEAMKMAPRTDGLPYEKEAVVLPTRCAECGFCVNACEFNAVSMGEWSKSAFQDHIESLLEPKDGRRRPTSIAFICERSFPQEGFYSPDLTRLASNSDVAAMSIPCIGVVSPAIVEYSLTAGAKGVMAIGCRGLDCHYREARRRLKLADGSMAYQFLVETMNIPNLKIWLVSPFEVDKMKRDIDEFNEQVKAGDFAVEAE